MTYRERAVATLKAFGEELINRAEELIPNAEKVKSINVWIKIPTLSDNMFDLPEMEVECEVYPSRVTLKKIMEIKQ